MSIVKRLSLVSAAAVLALAAAYVPASAQNTAPQTQQPRRTATQTAAQRRNYRSYSYEPSRGGDVGPRASSPTWQRADSKVKFRYGTYPY